MKQATPNTPDNSLQAVAAKLRLTLGMQRDGIIMMRQNLLRRYPHDSPEHISKRLTDWLAYSPDCDDPRFEIRPCKTPSNNS